MIKITSFITILAIVAALGDARSHTPKPPSKHESLKSLTKRQTPFGVNYENTKFNCFENGVHCLSVAGNAQADFEKYDFSTLDGSKGTCNYQFEHPTKTKHAGYITYSGECSSTGQAGWLIKCVNAPKAFVHVQFPQNGQTTFSTFYAHNGALASFASSPDDIKYSKSGEKKDANSAIVIKCPK